MNPLAEATSKLVDILTPISSEDRAKVVHAALTLLGDDISIKGKGTSHLPQYDNDNSLPELSSQGSAYLKKHNVSLEKLEQYLHFDNGKIQLIALPGSASAKSEQTMNTYLLQGFAAYLGTGEASFSDADARKACEHFGCYDSTNHAKNLKSLGNRIAGSKSDGWKLTAPGIAAALALLQ